MLAGTTVELRVKRFVVLACVLGAALAAVPALGQGRGAAVVVPIDGAVDNAMASAVARWAEAANRDGATIVLDIDTNDGLPDSAIRIRDTLSRSGVPVDAYVRHATSSGALVALAAQRIVMAPGATFGDAVPSPTTQAAVARERDEFERTASAHGRSPLIAGAMVDSTLRAPAYQEPGMPVTLTDVQARSAGVSENTAATLGAALDEFGLAASPQLRPAYTPSERFIRFATSPAISGILLALAFLGLLIELQTLHLVAGAVGAGALAIFFGAHVAGGFADTTVVAIGLAGIALILVELHVLPGHGVAGMLGVGALVASVVLSFGLPFIAGALQALAVAIVLSAIAFALLQRVLPENAFVRRLSFAGAQGPDYVASSDFRSLLGMKGVAVSFLRPVGLASFGDRRVDVLSEGDFVPSGTPVRVTRVEGARIFVRPEVEP